MPQICRQVGFQGCFCAVPLQPEVTDISGLLRGAIIPKILVAAQKAGNCGVFDTKLGHLLILILLAIFRCNGGLQK